MTPHFADDHLTVHIGDCSAVMAEMAAESVHCVVTSLIDLSADYIDQAMLRNAQAPLGLA